MKSNYILYTLISCFVLFSFTASAQQFRYGANIAPAASWWIVEGDLYITSGNSIGFQVGGTIDLTLGESERFAIQSGLNFTSTPGDLRFPTDGGKSRRTCRSWLRTGATRFRVP